MGIVPNNHQNSYNNETIITEHVKMPKHPGSSNLKNNFTLTITKTITITINGIMVIFEVFSGFCYFRLTLHLLLGAVVGIIRRETGGKGCGIGSSIVIVFRVVSQNYIPLSAQSPRSRLR